uniref:Uncharacterized protein n=1 Tax=Oryza barthii TaxID=65489 RepID=A0A0D3H5Y1_9ORYZ
MPLPSSMSGGVGVDAKVVSWYLSSTEAQPVLINNVTSATVFTIANLCSQLKLKNKIEEHLWSQLYYAV